MNKIIASIFNKIFLKKNSIKELESEEELEELKRRFEAKDFNYLKRVIEDGELLIKRHAINYLGKVKTQENYNFLFDKIINGQDEYINQNLYDSIKNIISKNNEIEITKEAKKLMSKMTHKYGSEEELIVQINELEINNFKLPQGLIKLIEKNKWKTKKINKEKLLKLTIEKSPFKDDKNLLKGMMNSFELYGLKEMKKESEMFIELKDLAGEVMFHGKNDIFVNPGKINPKKIIIFADFGIGNDTPFGLDYQKNSLNPSVILLYHGKDPNLDNRWVELTSTFNEFKSLLWIKN